MTTDTKESANAARYKSGAYQYCMVICRISLSSTFCARSLPFFDARYHKPLNANAVAA